MILHGTGATEKDIARAGVLLIGDGPTTLAALRSLATTCDVLGVLRAAPEDAAADPVFSYAMEHGIAVSPLENPRELADVIARLSPDAVVISSFNRIIPPDVLATSRFINVHYSRLPQYRGRANVNWALINGERAVGISVHLVAPGLDEGNLLFQEQVAITSADTVSSLYERLNAIQERELGPVVLRAIAGAPGTPQDHRHATYGCGRVPDDGEIDWSRSSGTIDRLICALSPPFSPAFTYLDCRRLAIVRAELRENPPHYAGRVPGRVVDRSRNGEWVDVLTGDGILRLFEVSLDHGAAAPASSIIRSTRTTLGLSRSDLLRRLAALEERLARLEAATAADDRTRVSADANALRR